MGIIIRKEEFDLEGGTIEVIVEHDYNKEKVTLTFGKREITLSEEELRFAVSLINETLGIKSYKMYNL